MDKQSPLLKALLKWTKTKVEVRGYSERWFATARTATTAENMQGFHEDNMLFIIDEASGVSDEIIEAILGTLSGKNNKLLMCGNPTKPQVCSLTATIVTVRYSRRIVFLRLTALARIKKT